jgi:uncharacterized membrane protein
MRERIQGWFVRFLRSFSFVGLIVGTLFFAASLTPSLLPRHYVVEGLLAGFSLAVGYGLGVALTHLYLFLGFRAPSAGVQRVAKWITVMAVAIMAITFLWRMTFWQNSIRVLMDLDPVHTSYPFRVIAIAVSLAVVLVTAGRLFLFAGRFVSRKMNRFLPPRIAFAAGFTVVTVAVFVLANDLVVRRLLDAANSFFATVDASVDDGVHQPADPAVCGSGESLVLWDSIGLRGKEFLVAGPTAESITEFSGRPAQRPIRVYVGLRSRPTKRLRAQLALEELKRVGGFDRSVLVVATPTGTGWLDPSAVNTLEYLHGGDTAIVSTQYSHLPSWITLMVDPHYSTDSARELFDVIYAYWTTLPKESRPRLYLHGLSLGALGSELSANLFTIFDDPIHGAVWSGPPFASRNWRSAVDNRNAGSPEWLPTFMDGRILRFMSNKQGLDPQAPWGSMRNVYIQHASDPMTWFSPRLAWSSPQWLEDPRGPDVSPDLRWFPLVTFLQIAFDMPMATSVPLGYGHNIGPASYIDAWVAVTQPQLWSDEKTLQLKAKFAQLEMAKP